MAWTCGKMGDENLIKRANAQKVEGKWGRGGHTLQLGLH